MKIHTETAALKEPGDAELVDASLKGDRQAFAVIVSRYQRLLCSLAYSSLGNLGESEDVAQETFVEAWKRLGTLQEPDKLKSWLCGILRFKISHHRRKEARQPVRHADELRESDGQIDSNESIEANAMKEQEQALLWQALASVPDTYRETLILYYREQQSIENVANELDLSPDAVKQRLSRGRKLVQQKMMTFLEGALERSAPGPAFTAGVVAALAAIPPAAKAAGTGAAAGATAAKVSSTVKWAGVVTLLASVSGFISSFFALRANLAQSRTGRERRAVIRATLWFVGVALVWVAAMIGLKQLAVGGFGNPGWLAFIAQALALAFTAGYLLMTVRLLRQSRALRSAEMLRRPELFETTAVEPGKRRKEIISRRTLFGLPLWHIKLDLAAAGEAPARGWIAVGHTAYGLLFAWGGYAVAPVSVGIVSFGVISIGAIGFGLVGLGAIAFGWLAIGASAVGNKAYGSLSALGWESAFSPGFATAREAAVGAIAHAREVNNELAYAIANLSVVDKNYVVVLGIMAALVIIPVAWYSRTVRKNFKPPQSD